MSKAQPAEPGPFSQNFDRSEVLSMLETAMNEAHDKIENGRIRDCEREKVRIQWIKAMGYLANCHRQIQRDKDLEELSDEVELLKDQL